MQNPHKEALVDAKEQLKYFTRKQAELNAEIKKLKRELAQDNRFMNNKFDIIQKTKLINYLFGILKEHKISSTCSVVGSFPRQIIEFSMRDSNSLLYGKPYNRDIDFVVFNAPADVALYDRFIEEITKDKKFFNNYSIVTFKDVTLKSAYGNPPGKKALENIPHHKLCLIDFDTNHKIDVDIIGWKPKSVDGWSEYDFDVNSLKMTSKGVTCSNYMRIVDGIINKEAKCIIDVNGLVEKAQAGTGRPNFKQYIAQVIYFLTERLKIVNDGYKVNSKKPLPIVYIEDEKPCDVTKCEAPYPVVQLECEHFITLPHLGYILTEGDKCPQCDKEIRLMMQSKPYGYNFSLESRCISHDAKAFLRRAITKIYSTSSVPDGKCTCHACRKKLQYGKKPLKLPMYYS